MTPENLEKSTELPKTTPENKEIVQDLVEQYKVAQKTENTLDAETRTQEKTQIKKLSLMERLKKAFGPDEKQQRIDEMKKQQEEQIMSSMTEDQKGKYQAFRQKYGYHAYAQWNPETGDYKAPHSDTANR